MKETMIDTKVTYTLEHDGRFFIVENVPAPCVRRQGTVTSLLRPWSTSKPLSRAGRGPTELSKPLCMIMHDM